MSLFYTPSSAVREMHTSVTDPAYSAVFDLPAEWVARYPATYAAYLRLSNPSASNANMIFNFAALFSGYDFGLSADSGLEVKFSPNTITLKARDTGNGNSGVGAGFTETTVAWDNKWYFMAVANDNISQKRCYIIDPADGTVVSEATVTATTQSSPALLTYVHPPKTLLSDTSATPNSTMTVAELCMWRRGLTREELQAFAQVGFASVNSPTDLLYDQNFIYNWTTVGDGMTIEDRSTFSNTGTLNAAIASNYTVDSPVPVFLTNLAASEHDKITIDAFSVFTGIANAAAYPAGTPEPSQADVFNGVGAVSTGTCTMDGIAEQPIEITGLTTGTDYVIYFVQDETGSGGYSQVYSFNVSTPYKYSEVLVDATGGELASKTGIEWAWFDSVAPNSFSSPAAKGTAEVTDGSGLLEVTLPTSISTAKGAQGTMVLEAQFGGDASPRSASHIVTVK